MKKILCILLSVLVFVGCEPCSDNAVVPPPEPIDPDPDIPDVPGEGDLPSQPIKRRPISPQDKTLRPRFTFRLNRLIELSFGPTSEPMCYSVTLRSESTGEEYTELIYAGDAVVTLPLMENTNEYTLTIEGDGVYYVENIIL